LEHGTRIWAVIENPDMQKSANERKRSYMQRGGNLTSLVARYLSQLKIGQWHQPLLVVILEGPGTVGSVKPKDMILVIVP
jgi:hypothetical protein